MEEEEEERQDLGLRFVGKRLNDMDRNMGRWRTWEVILSDETKTLTGGELRFSTAASEINARRANV